MEVRETQGRVTGPELVKNILGLIDLALPKTPENPVLVLVPRLMSNLYQTIDKRMMARITVVREVIKTKLKTMLVIRHHLRIRAAFNHLGEPPPPIKQVSVLEGSVLGCE